MSFLKKALLASFALTQMAYSLLDNGSSSNLAIYWGQGKLDSSLSQFCKKNADVSVIQLAFVTELSSWGGFPKADFTGEECTPFPGTNLGNCPKLGSEIKKCQSEGKSVILSIGGQTYHEGGFKTDQEATKSAETLWKTFGPKAASSKHRPFGDAVVDGFDFDLESSAPRMDTFAKHLRKLMNQASGSSKTKSRKNFYLTTAPQCPFPDQNVGKILSNVFLDAVLVQFYNNPQCGLNAFSNGQPQGFNFDKWDEWARTTSKNKNVKILIGIPASKDAAGSGYVDGDQLRAVVKYSQKFESLGGVMIWDSSHLAGNQGLLWSLSQTIKRLPPPRQTSSVTLFTTITTTYCPESSSLYNAFHSQTTQVRRSTKTSHTSQNSDFSILLQSSDNGSSLSSSPSPHSTRSSTTGATELSKTTSIQTQKPQRTVYQTTWVTAYY